MRIATRLFVRNVWLQAVLMAFAATLCAEFLWSPAPTTYTALEWAPYDTWMRLRSQPVRASHLLLVVRDQVSEQQLGTGHWDRSIPARLIMALHDAGAAALGIEVSLRDGGMKAQSRSVLVDGSVRIAELKQCSA